jgi:hypothetical protein
MKAKRYRQRRLDCVTTNCITTNLNVRDKPRRRRGLGSGAWLRWAGTQRPAWC